LPCFITRIPLRDSLSGRLSFEGYSGKKASPVFMELLTTITDKKYGIEKSRITLRPIFVSRQTDHTQSSPEREDSAPFQDQMSPDAPTDTFSLDISGK
jgi:hypothetical protein